MRHLLALLFVVLPASGLRQGPVAERRGAILETAQRFAIVRWKAEARRAIHGEDENGVRIDTPDEQLDEAGWKPGAENVGMPYCWGGFTSREGFEAELAQERWAGHVRKAGNAMGSGKTIGVDCSGFVSRCCNLPLKQSTRSLGALCYELDHYGQLLPAIVNRFDAHVALFAGWANDERTELKEIEAARLRVEESVYTLEQLRLLLEADHGEYGRGRAEHHYELTAFGRG